ncbi:hypothetical protein ACNPMZ_16015 [Acinetobacter pittii]|uniref:hypothetical protein n=1 Tax=Acinetobacter pittii TaxID=48296 RepID=UPI003AA7F38F
MNKLDLSVKVVQGRDSIEINHIAFENSAFIWPTDKSDLKLFVDQGALLVPSELEKSIYTSGFYLIFTDVSGIADDGGWDYIKVTHKNNLVYWEVRFNNGWVELVFDLTVYQKELFETMNQLKILPPNIIVQPSQIIFPE